MGMIALAGSKPGMEENLGIAFDEAPAARLRSYAEGDLPRHFGLKNNTPRKPKTRHSKPKKLRPMRIADFNKLTEEQTARHSWDTDAGAAYNKIGVDPRAVLFLDSGAFSVWSRGASIDIDDYAEFLAASKEYVDYAFNLDVLPGSPDRQRTRAEGEVAARQGMENWRELRKRGFELIHTYHESEPIEQLLLIRDEALEHMEDPYIALGGAKSLSTKLRIRWLAEVWKHLVDEDGRPLLKVHGLAITDYDGVTKFPWYSVDSTTWLNGDIYGTILGWATETSGKRALRQIVITFKKNHRGGWSHLRLPEKELIAKAFGVPAEEVPNLDSKEQGRRIMAHNLRMYKELESMIPDRLNVGPQPLNLLS